MNNYTSFALILCIIVLIMVLVGLVLYFYKQLSLANNRLVSENKRLMDLVVAKNTGEFMKLQQDSKTNKERPPTPRERLKQQMIDEGIYTPGAEDAFEHIVE